MHKLCPLATFSSNAMISKYCMGSRCRWYCEFAHDCSIPLLAGMFADSEICSNVFSQEESAPSGEKKESEETAVKKPVCFPIPYRIGTYRCSKCGTEYNNCMVGPPTRCTVCHLDFELIGGADNG